MKKILALVACLSLVASLAIGGSIAYLTDRDSEANVFTMGDVSIDLIEDNFTDQSQLLPGTDVAKNPQIENIGETDAYVWMTVAYPQGFDAVENQNVIEFLGMNSTNWNTNTGAAPVLNGKTIDESGDLYNIYTYFYQSELEVGKKTEELFTGVKLNSYIDIDPEGNFYHVQGGTTTPLDWNLTSNGKPTVYVSAYAIQSEGFANVYEAYDAYKGQWGEKGTEYGTPSESVTVTTADELVAAIANAEDNKLTTIQIPAGTTIASAAQIIVPASKNISILGGGAFEGQLKVSGQMKLSNLTIDDPDSVMDSVSQFSKSAIAVTGEGKVVCENVTFNQDFNESSAISAWWDTGKGTSIVVRKCTFNSNGQRPIRATGHVTIENCTFNDPYRYALQLTAKTSTATEMDKAIINFNNNTITNGENGKDFVYGIQLEGGTYGCNDCVINGAGNNIENGGADSCMYYCDCGKVDHDSIEWNIGGDTVKHETM